MTLDLEQVAVHLPAIIDTARREREAIAQRRDAALSALMLAAADIEAFSARVRAAATQRALALPLADRPDGVFGASIPDDYAILAVDGSHIQPQRDSPIPCSVMNLGWCKIVYREGYPPDLQAETEVQVASAADEGDPDQDFFSADALAIVRAVREVALAARLAEALPPDIPAVVLLDGSLVPWALNRFRRESPQRQRLLSGTNGLFPSLERLKQWALAAGHRAMAAYISYPAHREVIHALQEIVTDRNSVDTGSDRGLFWSFLPAATRSARFLLHSKREGWMEQEYDTAGHAIAFFYLRTAAEIARVEVPLWIAGDDKRVELVHAALLDQVERGLGYPLALMEAHERAVITSADRQAFAQLVESALIAEGLAGMGSAKDLSKRGRWLT